MKTPERIYLHRDRLGAVTWETEPDNNAIEYVRRDVAQSLWQARYTDREMILRQTAARLTESEGMEFSEEEIRRLVLDDPLLSRPAWLAEPTPAKEAKP